MAVLVTGASGFIGSRLTAKLASGSEAVVATYRDPGALARLEGLGPKVDLVRIDLSDQAAVERLLKRDDFRTVYHAAAAGVRPEAELVGPLIMGNIMGTVNLARASIANGVGRFVHLGSGFEYAPQATPIDESSKLAPVNLYGATKAAASTLLEYLHRAEGLPLVMVRPFSVFGPGENPARLIPYVLTAARDGKPIRLTSGRQIRDYVYLDDVVDAIERAGMVHRSVEGQAFNIGAGPEQARTVREVVTMAIEVAGGDPSLAQFGAIAPARPEPESFVADPSRARKELNWHCRYSLAEGLKRSLEALHDR